MISAPGLSGRTACRNCRAAFGAGRLSLFSSEHAEFVIIYYAIARLGAVLTTLHMAYGPNEAEPILRHARARAVFCSAASDKSNPPALFTALAQRLPNLQQSSRLVRIDRHTLIRDVNCERRSRRVAAAASGNGCGGNGLHVRNIGGTEGSSP